MQGKSGGEALNGVLKYGGDAGRYGAQVTNAFLGTSPHDLSRLISGTGRTFGAFARHEGELQELIVNFDVFTGALADAVREPRKHDPPLRADPEDRAHLAGQPQQDAAAAARLRDRADPRRRRAPRPDRGRRTVARTGPPAGLRQGGRRHRQAARRSDARASPAPPRKARPIALPQLNRLSLCGSKVLIPTGNQTINDQFSTGGPNYREFFYTLTDFAGQSQNFDGNGPYFRIQPGGGDVLVGEPNPDGNLTTGQDRLRLHQHAAARRRSRSSRAVRRRSPKSRCDKQPVPDVNSGLGQPAPRP